MIIVKIYGGMANQLFQYAAGYALSMHHATALKIDTSYFQEKNKDTKRSFALDKFNINYELASQEEIDDVFKFRSIDYAWNKFLPTSKKRFYGEKKPGFNEHFFDLSDTVYLRGYFQSEKYFIDCQKSLLEQYQVKTNGLEPVLPLAEILKNSNSVALHIRLGDYLNPTLSSIMAPFDIAYYQRAVDYFQQHIIHPTFYVFSDQIQLAKDLLKIDAEFVFVDEKMSANSDTDFYLMQSCQHQIIANSTFSWWAAYLNKHTHKIVVAPQKWYKDHFGDATDLYPNNWVVL
jgi:hypothetical protein